VQRAVVEGKEVVGERTTTASLRGTREGGREGGREDECGGLGGREGGSGWAAAAGWSRGAEGVGAAAGGGEGKGEWKHSSGTHACTYAGREGGRVGEMGG